MFNLKHSFYNIQKWKLHKILLSYFSTECFGRTIFLIVYSITILTAATTGIYAFSVEEDKLPFDVSKWLDGPDREDFSWDVQMSFPYLTMQQRHSVEIRAYLDDLLLRDSQIKHDLHFVIKVATKDHGWFPGSSHTRISIPAKAKNVSEYSFEDSVLFRPGVYTIALIVYDPILDKGNIRRKQVEVSPLGGDKLPELEKDLPYVDFTNKAKIGSGKEWLPVNNSRNLCIDTIVNISMDWNHDPRLSRKWAPPGFGNPRGFYVLPNVKLETILQAASVLSHIEPLRGQNRISIVDTLRMKTLYNREGASTFNWKKSSQKVLDWHNENLPEEQDGTDNTSINYPGIPIQASAYLHDILQQIMDDDNCISHTEDAIRIIIIVSPEMLFGDNAVIQEVEIQDQSSIQFYYFQIPKSTLSGDDLHKMLKRTKLKIYSVGNPRSIRDRLTPLSFRDNLKKFISKLEEISQ